MDTRLWVPLAGAIAAVVFTLVAIVAPVTEAAGQFVHAGRGGVFVVTTPGPASAASVITGVAVSVAAMAGVAYLSLALGRSRGGAGLRAVPATDEGEPRPGEDVAPEERGRKAA